MKINATIRTYIHAALQVDTKETEQEIPSMQNYSSISMFRTESQRQSVF